MLELLKLLKSWLEDIIIGNPSGRTNILDNINSYSGYTLNIVILGKLLFNRGFLVGFLEAIGKISN